MTQTPQDDPFTETGVGLWYRLRSVVRSAFTNPMEVHTGVDSGKRPATVVKRFVLEFGGRVNGTLLP